MKAQTFIYTAQIPTGQARTKGYGKTCAVYVIRCERPENFRTLNSLTCNRVGAWKKWNVGTARFDYGMKRGKSAQLMREAKELCAMVSLPDERTTRDEF